MSDFGVQEQWLVRLPGRVALEARVLVSRVSVLSSTYLCHGTCICHRQKLPHHLLLCCHAEAHSFHLHSIRTAKEQPTMCTYISSCRGWSLPLPHFAGYQLLAWWHLADPRTTRWQLVVSSVTAIGNEHSAPSEVLNVLVEPTAFDGQNVLSAPRRAAVGPVY